MVSVMDKKLALKIENAEADILCSRLTAIKEMHGNPMGVEIKSFGNTVAFSVKNIPGPAFNTVKGLSDADENQVEKIISFYNQKGIPAHFELIPGQVSPELLKYLHSLGFYQQDFHTSLYKTTDNKTIEDINDTEISIRKLKEDEFDTFAEIYTVGFNMPAFVKNGVAQNNKILCNHPNWTFYLASIDNRPAGVGVLFMKNRIATLAAAATFPSFRNKGIHTALIKRRMYQATQEACDLIVGQAKFGSVSQNNMERAGLRIGYTKVIWVRD